MQADFGRVFKKQYKKLPKKIQHKFGERMLFFSLDMLNPVLNSHDVHYPYEGCRSINVTGDHRAIYIRNDDGSILFVRIGTHSELYK